MTLVQPIRTPGCGCDAQQTRMSLVTVDTALDRIAAAVQPIAETEELSLSKALGRVLAAPVTAAAMVPPFDNSAMDGYAVARADLTGQGPWTLPVRGRVAAGASSPGPLAGRDAMRIFTGAPVPTGADAVIAQEAVRVAGETVIIQVRPDAGQNIRHAGRDMRLGQIVLKGGTRLGSREIAACAAAGAGRVSVQRPLRVSLLVTGNEVQSAGSTRDAAQIWDINTPMMMAALSRAGIDLVRTARGADCRAALQATLAELSACSDLVITTGGISVGEEDHVKPAMQALGAEIVFSGVAIKPGKPVSFGRVGKALWLGLPGNPLSAYVTWEVFGTAILRAMLGLLPGRPARRHVLLGRELRRRPGRCELRPARLVGFDGQGREVVEFEDRLQSGHVAGLPLADGLIFLPNDTERLPRGALVEFHPFSAP